jgi:predicted dithiol-disulfide oxidoreductase (DUF899 family)
MRTPVDLSELFGDKQTPAIYSMMYGPQRLDRADVHVAAIRLGR